MPAGPRPWWGGGRQASGKQGADGDSVPGLRGCPLLGRSASQTLLLPLETCPLDPMPLTPKRETPVPNTPQANSHSQKRTGPRQLLDTFLHPITGPGVPPRPCTNSSDPQVPRGRSPTMWCQGPAKDPASWVLGREGEREKRAHTLPPRHPKHARACTHQPPAPLRLGSPPHTGQGCSSDLSQGQPGPGAPHTLQRARPVRPLCAQLLPRPQPHPSEQRQRRLRSAQAGPAAAESVPRSNAARDRSWGREGHRHQHEGSALLCPNMETRGLLGMAQGSFGRPGHLGLQGEQGGEGLKLGGKGERCLLPDQGSRSPLRPCGPAGRPRCRGWDWVCWSQMARA